MKNAHFHNQVRMSAKEQSRFRTDQLRQRISIITAAVLAALLESNVQTSIDAVVKHYSRAIKYREMGTTLHDGRMTSFLGDRQLQAFCTVASLASAKSWITAPKAPRAKTSRTATWRNAGSARFHTIPKQLYSHIPVNLNCGMSDGPYRYFVSLEWATGGANEL
jgi:hypothetical protein